MTNNVTTQLFVVENYYSSGQQHPDTIEPLHLFIGGIPEIFVDCTFHMCIFHLCLFTCYRWPKYKGEAQEKLAGA